MYKSETLNFSSMLKCLPSDVSYKKLLQVLLHDPFWISSSFLLCIHLRSSVIRLLFRNHILWFDHKKPLSISLFISTTTSSSCPFSQRGTLWLPLKVKLKMSSASFLNNSSNFTDFILSFSSSFCFIKRHSPAYSPTLLTLSVSWLLRSSSWQTAFHSPQSHRYSSSQGIRLLSHLALKIADTPFYFFIISIQKLLDMQAYSVSVTEQPVGSQPHRLGRKLCQHNSGAVNTAGLSKQALFLSPNCNHKVNFAEAP